MHKTLFVHSSNNMMNTIATCSKGNYNKRSLSPEEENNLKRLEEYLEGKDPPTELWERSADKSQFLRSLQRFTNS